MGFTIMKKLIKKILREDLKINDSRSRKLLEPLKRYLFSRGLPNYICFSLVIIGKNNNPMVLLVGNDLYHSGNFDIKLQSEISNVFNTSDITIMLYHSNHSSPFLDCQEYLNMLRKQDNYNKTFFIIPNKGYPSKFD
jgi:hypothetical protein